MGTNDRLRVMLATEGTYPFHQGGVSTWCNFLVSRLTNIDYVIYSIIMDPFVTQKFSLPPNAGLVKVPLWGTEDPSEHLTVPFSEIYATKKKTSVKVVENHFAPLFHSLITEILGLEKSPARFGRILLELNRYFREYDYKNSFKSRGTWEIFKKIVLSGTADRHNKLALPSVFDLIQSLGWIYRFLIILNTPVPRVDVGHAAAAAFCGIPCALAKMEFQTPFLLTEHGVYLREQYLALSRNRYSSYLSTFLIRLLHSISSLNYALADQISPVCAYNTRWEKEFGSAPEVIKVIYNGVDKEVFSPDVVRPKNDHPTVVSVARIDPVKDLITMLRAAALVKEQIPAVRFIIYGSVSVPAYYEECLAELKALGLEGTFIFAGHTDDAPAAYRSGDVVALSSITEAFPYAVVEAMMSGKAIVATDVGGVREALGDCGLVVGPRQPEQLAQALIALLQDASFRSSLGRDARERALNYFTLDRALELYASSYRQLASREAKPRVVDINLRRQKLLAEKAYALAELGYWQEAAAHFRLAIEAAVDSPAVPVLLTETARVYTRLGQINRAATELEKARALVDFWEKFRKTA